LKQSLINRNKPSIFFPLKIVIESVKIFARNPNNLKRIFCLNNKDMKFCPTCQTRYDEEILRFCTKDGTPLVEEETPHFTELPSESGEDDGEETVVRRTPSVPITPPLVETEIERNSAPRIVIPTTEEKPPPPVWTKTTASYRRQPLGQKGNTGRTIFLTILGTIAILGSVAGIYWLFSNQNSNGANKNTSINANFNSIDTNLNTNLNLGNSNTNYNFNVNSASNSNSNVKTNVNANIKTPTPTPKASPSQSATPNNSFNLNNSNLSTPAPTPRTIPSPPPPPSATPRPSPSDDPGNRAVNAGVLNGRAINLPKPAYPPIARQARASGQVAVQVLLDEGGNVLSARATSGHPMLRAPAEAAARQSRFNPVRIGDRSVKATGILLYNFTNQ
jgi:TonB family protein